jgi:hypothetical protein
MCLYLKRIDAFLGQHVCMNRFIAKGRFTRDVHANRLVAIVVKLLIVDCTISFICINAGRVDEEKIMQL